MFRALNWAWARKPMMPMAEYRPLLGEMLSSALAFRDSVTTMEEVWRNAVVNNVEDIGDIWPKLVLETETLSNRLIDLATQLEKVRPELDELVEAHMRSVGFTRGVLRYNDARVGGLVTLFQGDIQRASALERQAETWKRDMTIAKSGLIETLRSLHSEHPAAFNALQLPEAAMYEFGFLDSLGYTPFRH
jgi:hypothetical protein